MLTQILHTKPESIVRQASLKFGDDVSSDKLPLSGDDEIEEIDPAEVYTFDDFIAKDEKLEV